MSRPQPPFGPNQAIIAYLGGLLLVGLTAVAYESIWDAAQATRRAGAGHLWEIPDIAIAATTGLGLLLTGAYGVRACVISWHRLRF